jgi:hypothetical protein
MRRPRTPPTAVVATRSLLTSSSSGVTPAVQRRRERALIEAAALGEIHLHVSVLAGEVLSLGAFHLEPRAASGSGDTRCWRRFTGGRAIAAGRGFVVVTLGLPHRSALVADERYALAPEQVMNRCVRGLLTWLRGHGLDPVYPGLDLVTVSRRALAHVSFAEQADGPTLFQAIVAAEASFATTPRLLDRVDPLGVVPVHLVSSSEATTLAEALGRAAQGPGDAAAAATALGAAYADSFRLEPEELDPAVTEVMLADESEPPPEVPRALAADASTATEHGLLGPVTAAARVVGAEVAEFALTGDLIAPTAAIPALAARLVGGPASEEAATSALAAVLDGKRRYVLGLRPPALRRLVTRVVTGA